jgi:hypothetical protein
LDFLDFQYPSTEFGIAQFKTNIEKAVFCIFMSSYAEMRFWAQKVKKSQSQKAPFFKGLEIFFLKTVFGSNF